MLRDSFADAMDDFLAAQFHKAIWCITAAILMSWQTENNRIFLCMKQWNGALGSC